MTTGLTTYHANATKPPLGNCYLFQGREYSWATGLYYFRARWYDPVAGRFISKDPIGISGGLNQYVFCANNPVNGIDPDGLATYLQNRELGGDQSRANYNPVSHSFVFTTNPDGTLKHAYSWGNEGAFGTWHIDEPLDITAANQALKNPKGLRKRGCDAMDSYVDQVFRDWQYDLNHMHWNLVIANNCKIEARKMLNEAAQRMTNPNHVPVSNDSRNYNYFNTGGAPNVGLNSMMLP